MVMSEESNNTSLTPTAEVVGILELSEELI